MAGILDRDEEFEQLGKDKSLVITALALERMWMPHWIGVQKTDYTDEECALHIKITEEWMQLIWGRIERGHALPGDYDRFVELLELMNNALDSETTANEADLDRNAYYFLDGILDCAKSFLVENKFVSGKCKRLVDGVLNMVMDQLENYLFDNLYESSDEIKEKNQKLSDYIFEHHPAIAVEVSNVKADKELVLNYPQNMAQIRKKRAEYHNLNLLDFKPLEEYGIHVGVIK